MIAFCDTETNGLNRPMGTALDQFPNITEVCIILTDNKLNVHDKLSTLIWSPVVQPEHIIKITGITDDMLKDAPYFKDTFNPLQHLFDQADILVMQNWCFDETILKTEATRIDKKLKFPKPFCTVEESMFLYGRRLKLQELFKLATGLFDYGAHRAEGDVLAMIEVYRWLKTITPNSKGVAA